ncbi:RecBCD enzyme subunit RecB [Nocardioides phosphati]|uniref:RecBCD enzyme subunit RecB n=1 Tax=Nocardioides phosphati TaxID=1867775 RepID=A0ABQ2NBL0_9ACTN|nr:UvrD-helicase domain-containing protein [Nocardioides phosphati]GGO90378.1 RecBCD enzyme subunit RecB [Nocardioides phosphati]
MTATGRAIGRFDVRGPLPTGTTLLEASAGTGKTWTIAALVTRFVAEGEALLEQMLVVTFGRAASQELRERVRAQLVCAERALAAPAAVIPGDDELIDLLLDAPPAELALRAGRLRQALADFDVATIATIHQFCQQVLRGLGVAGDSDAGAQLVEDLDDLLVEVVDDLYLRAYAGSAADQPPAFSRKDALALGRAAVVDPRARLEPADAAAGSTPAVRVAFAQAVRAEFERRKRRLGLLGYDDLLGQLADALAVPDSPAAQRMRARWKVVLVDEFQDTDPVQWQVFDRAFSGHATMVLIGDPKQAIYAFRGGDVATYLAAAETAGSQATLGVNWRSDSDLVDALQVVLRGAALGDERIVVHDVEAHHRGGRLEGAGAPFRLRVVRPQELGMGERRAPSVAAIRDHLWPDVAHDIKRLLTSGATFEGRPLEPADVAVLAHKHSDLASIQAALAELGVPAVVAGNGSVFSTPAAREWLTLVEALEQPHRPPRVRSAALTSFLGHTAADLAEGGDALTDVVAETVRTWSELATSRGIAAVMEAAVTGGLTARVLRCTGGERLLTDLRHIGQVLHKVAAEERLGLVALAGWLRDQIADDRPDTAGERTRRLDSDAAAVQLVTIHGSKGLQYPVVYLPSLWDRWPRDPAVALFHGPDGVRCRNVGGPGPTWSPHAALHLAEEAGEALRLLYVALTRAQSQVVAWYAPAPRNAPTSALHRLLLGRRPGTPAVPDSHPVETAESLVAKLDWYAANGGPCWEPAVRATVASEPLPTDHAALAVRSFDRSIDTAWRRTSYSALTAVDPTPGHGSAGAAAAGLSEPELVPRDDEQDGAGASVSPVGQADLATSPGPGLGGESAPALAIAKAREDLSGAVDGRGTPPRAARSEVPMATLPMGATFGSLVHAVLEHADPAAPDFDGDLRAELLHHIDEQLTWWPVTVDREELADALVAVCDSPLGPLAGDLTLRELSRGDRLCELDFEVPLAGGDLAAATTGGAASPLLGDLAPLLEKHLPGGDPVRSYTAALNDPALGGQSLRGYLTGSIDVVLRVTTQAGPRFLTVDYKTNWLAQPGHELSIDDYRPEALDAAMGHSDYPLQALLYVVVLHRYLRWRLPGYAPEQHLGGVLYLYLRGMVGPATPRDGDRPYGVFAWQPPVALVEAVSDLLDGSAQGGSR